MTPGGIPEQTIALVAATVGVSLLGWRSPVLQRLLVYWPPAVVQGRQYHRLLTYGLVHADGQHLIFNMLTLWFFGPPIEGLFERALGPLAYLAFYAVALVLAIMPAHWRHRNDAGYVSLGASGAVSAVLFAFVVLRPWSTIVAFVVPLPAVVYAALYITYSAVMDRLRRDHVNHSAHLAGALFGAAFVFALVPGALDSFLQQVIHPSFLR